jgi:hypothetical protein
MISQLFLAIAVVFLAFSVRKLLESPDSPRIAPLAWVHLALIFAVIGGGLAVVQMLLR